MALADTLPQYITDILTSKEYEDFIESLKTGYALTNEQTSECEDIIFDLFRKKIDPSLILDAIVKRIGLDEKQSKEIAREVLLNIVIAFHYFFGDYSSAYALLGGNIDQDTEASPILRALSKRTISILEQYVKEVSRIDFSKEQNAMREFFAKHLVVHFYAPDGDYKIRLNDTILALLQMYDAYNEKLLGALYENEQEIGTVDITLPDGKVQRPTVAYWIQDYLGFSGGTVSSITMAKYMSQNKNVSALQERDKDAVRRLLETFIVLKNFPESLDSISDDQWKIIPYYHNEEATKVPRRTVETAPNANIEKIDIKIDISDVVDAVIANAGVILSDDVRARVKKIIETRVRNVRNDIDTRERLTAAVAEGGAGIAAEGAEKMLAEVKKAQQFIADGKANEYAPKGIEPMPIESAEITASAGMTIGKEKEELPKMVIKEVDGVPMIVEKGSGTNSRVREIEPDPNILNIKPAPSAKPDTILSQLPTGEQALPVAVPKHLEGAQVIPVIVVGKGLSVEKGSGTNSRVREIEPVHNIRTDINAKLNQKSFSKIGTEKKPIPDVKAMPRLVTVIDELRALTIKDIRRISQNPGAACQKIADKINALAKESLSRRAEAINAWKESPCYALYIEIGQLNIGQDMAKIAEERKTAGKEYLTAEEFDAFLVLNEKLRF